MNQVKTIIKYFIALVWSPQLRWQYLTDRELPEAQAEHVSRYYYWPLMGCCAVCLFLLRGMFGASGGFSLEMALRSATSFLLSFLAGPYVAQFLLSRLGRFYGVTAGREQLFVFILYTLSFDMVIEVLSALMHGIRFFDLLILYQGVIVWAASTTFLGVSASRRLGFTLLTSVVLFGSHWLFGPILDYVGSR